MEEGLCEGVSEWAVFGMSKIIYYLYIVLYIYILFIVILNLDNYFIHHHLVICNSSFLKSLSGQG